MLTELWYLQWSKFRSLKRKKKIREKLNETTHWNCVDANQLNRNGKIKSIRNQIRNKSRRKVSKYLFFFFVAISLIEKKKIKNIVKHKNKTIIGLSFFFVADWLVDQWSLIVQDQLYLNAHLVYFVFMFIYSLSKWETERIYF